MSTTASPGPLGANAKRCAVGDLLDPRVAWATCSSAPTRRAGAGLYCRGLWQCMMSTPPRKSRNLVNQFPGLESLGNRPCSLECGLPFVSSCRSVIYFFFLLAHPLFFLHVVGHRVTMPVNRMCQFFCNLRTVVENTPFLCLSARLAH